MAMGDSIKRLCLGCGRERFPDDFKQGSDECEVCVYKRSATKDKARRDRALNSIVSLVSNASRNGNADVPNLGEMAGEMVSRFGGMSMFCDEWYRHMQMVFTLRPGSHAALMAFREIAMIVKAVQVQNTSKTDDLSAFSDDEIKSYLKSVILEAEVEKSHDQVPEGELPDVPIISADGKRLRINEASKLEAMEDA